ncbi:MAG: cupredoxin domain-containing protein [Candidatus Limnocylindria bacterium]
MSSIRNGPPLNAVAALVAAIGLGIAALAVSPGASAGASHAVQIAEFAFTPAVVTVNVGDTVTWTNLDAVVHTATSTAGTFDSGDLAQGQSFTVTFTAPGTYPYVCTPHPSMTGTIVVAAAATPAPTAVPTATATGGAGLPNVAMPAAASASSRLLPVIGVALVVVGLLVVARQAVRRRRSG